MSAILFWCLVVAGGLAITGLFWLMTHLSSLRDRRQVKRRLNALKSSAPSLTIWLTPEDEQEIQRQVQQVQQFLSRK